MRLYWSSRSPFVRKVMVAAHELGVVERVEIVPTMVRMDRVNPEVLRDNPLGKIPALVLEDGTAIYDSLVICEYLDGLAGPRLFPDAGRTRWEALRWHALGQGLMEALVLWRNEREKPAGQRSEAWIEGFGLKTTATLDHLEGLRLGEGAFGIGQIAIGCALSYLDFRFAGLGWREGRPGLARWHAGFEARPSAVASAFVDQ